MTTRPEPEVIDRASWWTTGQVATALGVSPVLLRAWDGRYGLGPARRGPGGQRLYGPRELQRLRRMSALVNQGVRAGTAAGLVLSEAVSPAQSRLLADEIDQAAAAVDLPTLAGLLDDLLAGHGTIAAWVDVLAPVLRRQGERWQAGESAFAAEWALAGAVSAALERQAGRVPLPPPRDRPVLLACCATERHPLPLQVLFTVLREAGIPVVFLGEMVAPGVVVRTAVRLDPALVLLWSMTPYTADAPLLAELARRDVPVRAAGPGWNSVGGRVGPVLDGLRGALRAVSAHTGRAWP
ncbi:MerR family transcriptional regulator [Amycolatopsis mediterranei S699]|uniref:MerR family transcriptional regulator n=3 Tax=Amycolatopsis mediterranei TaxID=33910 RepID=A0A0H3D8J0_AMYMU|nr:MerR family transcriptional regulator [Amycolatopsis mediterranei]ADJ45859.1 MerR family transcriptional regulator [Amycolatopsis mediterranei U32]AEK42640.1 MerR family transcriptional regulator [Amycolatopsis mediterranei S699]AFO77570.1 MerR family transcriptional regulator [Amycolatopsis mediterranei S699]AGT84698.1 MerR family transcriptional regulator [Amycolatopsis mediterranei RB]KDO05394.1 MerR family transcriptional regulator [Amycolatopsis mediterranei]